MEGVVFGALPVGLPLQKRGRPGCWGPVGAGIGEMRGLSAEQEKKPCRFKGSGGWGPTVSAKPGRSDILALQSLGWVSQRSLHPLGTVLLGLGDLVIWDD